MHLNNMRQVVILCLFFLHGAVSSESDFLEDGRSYQYDYIGKLDVKSGSGNEITHQVKTMCQFTVKSIGVPKNHFEMKISNFTLVNYNGVIYENVDLDHLSSLRESIVFHLKDGKVTEIFNHKTDVPMSINIKKSIISHFDKLHLSSNELKMCDKKDNVKCHHHCSYDKNPTEKDLSSISCSTKYNFQDGGSGFYPEININTDVTLVSVGIVNDNSPDTIQLKDMHATDLHNTLEHGHINPLRENLINTLTELVTSTLRNFGPPTTQTFGKLIHVLHQESGLYPLLDIQKVWEALSHQTNISQSKEIAENYLVNALLLCRSKSCNKVLHYLIFAEDFTNPSNLDHILSYWKCHPDIDNLESIIEICAKQSSQKCLHILTTLLPQHLEVKKDLHSLCDKLFYTISDPTAVEEMRLLSLHFTSRGHCVPLTKIDTLSLALDKVNNVKNKICFLLEMRHLIMSRSEYDNDKPEDIGHVLQSLDIKLKSLIEEDELNSEDIESYESNETIISKCQQLYMQEEQEEAGECFLNTLLPLPDFPKADFLPDFKNLNMDSIMKYLQFEATVSESCGSGLHPYKHLCFLLNNTQHFTETQRPHFMMISEFLALNGNNVFNMLPKDLHHGLVQKLWKHLHSFKLTGSSDQFFKPLYHSSFEVANFMGFPIIWEVLYTGAGSFKALNDKASLTTSNHLSIFFTAKSTLSAMFPSLMNVTLDRSRYVWLNKTLDVLIKMEENDTVIKIIMPEEEDFLHLSTKEQITQEDKACKDITSEEMNCTPDFLNTILGLKFCQLIMRTKSKGCFHDAQTYSLRKNDKDMHAYKVTIKQGATDNAQRVIHFEAPGSFLRRELILSFRYEDGKLHVFNLTVPEMESFLAYQDFASNLHTLGKKNISAVLKVFGNYIRAVYSSALEAVNTKDASDPINSYMMLNNISITGAVRNFHFDTNVSIALDNIASTTHLQAVLTSLKPQPKVMGLYRLHFMKRNRCPTYFLSHNLTSDYFIFSSNLTEECAEVPDKSKMFINVTLSSSQCEALNWDIQEIVWFGNPGGESVNVSSKYLTINVTANWDVNDRVVFNKTATFMAHNNGFVPNMTLRLEKTYWEYLRFEIDMLNTSNPKLWTLVWNADKQLQEKFLDLFYKERTEDNPVLRIGWLSSTKDEHHNPVCLCYDLDYISRLAARMIPSSTDALLLVTSYVPSSAVNLFEQLHKIA